MTKATSTAHLASLRLIVLDAHSQGFEGIYLQPGRSPCYHLSSKFLMQDHLAPLTPEQFEHYLAEVLTREQLECYRTHQKLDAQVSIPNVLQAQIRCGLTAQGQESMSLNAIVLEDVNQSSQRISTQEVEKLSAPTISTNQIDSVPFYALVEFVDALPEDDQEMLFELIRKRRIDKRRKEIAENALQTLAAFRAGTAKCGSVEALMLDVLDDNSDDE